jgi:hypothetical protein
MLKGLFSMLIMLFLIQFAAAETAFNGNFRSPVIQRDPFTTSDKMYGEVGIQSAQKASAQQGFIPGYGVQNVPKMRLKGYATKSHNKSTALLEIEGAGVYMVSKGDEIGLHSVGQNTVLKIVDVGPNGVKVQSGQVNQVIVVR